MTLPLLHLHVRLVIAGALQIAAVSAWAAVPAAESPMPQRIAFPHLPNPVGPYSHGVRHGSTLYLSGLTAIGTQAHDADAGTQARTILAQIEEVLRQQQIDWDSLLKVTVFVVGRENLSAVRAALMETYGHIPPASSMVLVDGLVDPALKVEIEAIIGLPTLSSPTGASL